MADLTVSFELYNEETVRILKEEDPDLLPDYSVNSSKDLAYNKKQVTSAITSGIIKGESIPKIASNLQSTIKSLNQSSAVSTARTAAIAAQNTGSLSAMRRLAEMGVEVQKEWVATLDIRTRPSHRALDGQRRNLDEAFSNGLQYPGASGNPAERWNCRCKIKAYMPKYDSEDEPRLTYSEWTAKKQASNIVSGTTDFNNLRYDYEFDTENKTLKITYSDGRTELYDPSTDTVTYAYNGKSMTFGAIGSIKDVYNHIADLVEDKITAAKIRATYTAKNLYPDKIAGVSRGNNMTYDEADNYKVNPLYGTNQSYSENCQTCVVAFEARQRGYSVKAKGATSTAAYKLSCDTTLAWRELTTGKHPANTNVSARTAKDVYDRIVTTVSSGCRYTLTWEWRSSRAGHIVNLDIDNNGEIRIKDNQRGVSEQSEWIGENDIVQYLSNTDTYTVKILRVDNLLFDEKIVNEILEKE